VLSGHCIYRRAIKSYPSTMRSTVSLMPCDTPQARTKSPKETKGGRAPEFRVHPKGDHGPSELGNLCVPATVFIYSNMHAGHGAAYKPHNMPLNWTDNVCCACYFSNNCNICVSLLISTDYRAFKPMVAFFVNKLTYLNLTSINILFTYHTMPFTNLK